MQQGYRYYLIGFSPQHPTDYEREVIEHLRKASRLDVEAYAGPGATPQTIGIPAFNPPAVVNVGAIAPAMTGPSAPWAGANVKPYVSENGTGFKAYDRETRTTWLYNSHPAMPNTWKARVAGVWMPITERERLLGLVRATTPGTAATAAPLPFAAPTKPAPVKRKARK